MHKALSVLTIAAILAAMLLVFVPSGTVSAYDDPTVLVSDTNTHAQSVRIASGRTTFLAAGRYWVFYGEGTGAGTNYVGYRSTLDGVTWTAFVSLTAAPFTVGVRYFDSVWDGTYIHYVLNDEYRRGTPNRDGTITWCAAVSEILPAPHDRRRIGVSLDGYPFLVYTTSFPHNIKIARSSTNDGTWTNTGDEYQLHAYGIEDWVGQIHGLSDDGDIGVIYTKGGSDDHDLYWRTWDQSAAVGNITAGWSAQSTINSAGKEPYYQGFSSASFDDAGTIKIYLAWTQHERDAIVTMEYTHGVGWDSETEIASGSSDMVQIPTMSILNSDGDYRVAWLVTGSPDALWYRDKEDGGAWGTSVNWFNTPVCEYRYNAPAVWSGTDDVWWFMYLEETSYDVRFYGDPARPPNPTFEVEYSASKDSSTWNVPGGTGTKEYVGRSGPHYLHAMWEFPFDLTGDIVIIEATMTLYREGAGLNNQNYLARRLVRLDWVETQMDNDEYKTGGSWTSEWGGHDGDDHTTVDEATTYITASTGYFDWDLTDQVQWAVDNATTVAVRLSPTTMPEVSDVTSEFSSRTHGTENRRPVLTVEYQYITVPDMSSSAATAVTNADRLHGLVEDDGGGTMSMVGFEWGTSSGAPYAYDTDITYSTDAFTYDLTGFDQNTTVYWRAYGTNEEGTTYTPERSFSTTPEPPTVTTDSATDVAGVTATLIGTLDIGSFASVDVYFEYWEDGATVYSTADEAMVSGGVFDADLTGLEPTTTYSYRACVDYDWGIVYGTTRSFTTTARQLPIDFGDTVVEYAFPLLAAGGVMLAGLVRSRGNPFIMFAAVGIAIVAFIIIKAFVGALL